MFINLSATGKPRNATVFFLSQLGITLISLPPLYIAGSFLRTNTAVALAAVAVLIMVFGWARRLVLPQSLSLRTEEDGSLLFNGHFVDSRVPISRQKKLLRSCIVQDDLVLEAVDDEECHSLTTRHFEPATLAALAAAITQLASGNEPDLDGLSKSVGVKRLHHKGNLMILISEKPSTVLLQTLAAGSGLMVLFAYVWIAH
jgi:hypothetical protein